MVLESGVFLPCSTNTADDPAIELSKAELRSFNNTTSCTSLTPLTSLTSHHSHHSHPTSFTSHTSHLLPITHHIAHRVSHLTSHVTHHISHNISHHISNNFSRHHLQTHLQSPLTSHLTTSLTSLTSLTSHTSHLTCHITSRCIAGAQNAVFFHFKMRLQSPKRNLGERAGARIVLDVSCVATRLSNMNVAAPIAFCIP